MKISLKWLHDFVDVKEYFRKPQDLAEILTQAGLEVEEIKDRGRDLNHVVIGVILEKAQHPNADKLSLCRVATGEGVVHQIVCGAKNHKANDRVVVALPGAVLPGNFAIKVSSLRGIESGGMLCSFKELGLPEQGDGIIILPTEAPIGQAYATWAGLDDITFELKVTPNRADCLSHYGLAREVACLLKKELKAVQPIFKMSTESTQKRIKLEVKALDLCPRYTGRVIQNLRVQKSPPWLQARLESVGVNSINNIVDVTNYVMFELGQPLHAFDAKSIADQSLVVDRAMVGEKFITLDGSELKLLGTELTIRDSQRALCLAGTIGGQNSGVSDSTQDIFLEAAYFSSVSVRKTSRGLGVDTDSAYRFSRGVDPEGVLRALDRATELILQVAGGEALCEHYDVYPQPAKRNLIQVSVQTVSDRLGFEAQEGKLTDYLVRLGCEIENQGSGIWGVRPPSFRVDIEHEMDLVEEYARLEGYHHIPETLPVFHEVPAVHDKNFLLNQRVSETLRGQGYDQAFNFSFTSSVGQKNFVKDSRPLLAAGLSFSDQEVFLKNPLSEELNVMRGGLSFGLYRNMLNNYRHGNEVGRLFESGACFQTEGTSFLQGSRLALIAWGQDKNLWNRHLEAPLVFEVKAAIENLLRSFHITQWTWQVPQDRGEVPAFLHRGQFAQLVVESRKLGCIGSLHPALLDEEKIRVPVALAEFDLERLLQGQPRSYHTESVSKMPLVQRDFAFIMPKSLKIGNVLQHLKKLLGTLLIHTDVFDVYEGENLETGMKSVAFRIHLQDRNGTLQDAALTEIQNKVIEGLKGEFHLSMR